MGRLSAPHIELDNVSKSFGATRAVRDLSLEVHRGAVHAIVGENGAGKSTVGKIVAGVHRPDRGRVLLDGEPVAFRSPRDALAHGITVVAQELSLVPGRSVIDNVFLGGEPSLGGVVRTRVQHRLFDDLVERTSIDVPGEALVADLPVAEQQKVEILRALGRRADLIVMDEPTARLSTEEAGTLLAIVNRLSQDGTTVILVSHFLDQVLQVSDRVSVMRDGALVSSRPAASETARSLVEAMTGRSLDTNFPAKVPAPADARWCSTSGRCGGPAICPRSASRYAPVRSSGWPGWSARGARRSSERCTAPTRAPAARSGCAAERPGDDPRATPSAPEWA